MKAKKIVKGLELMQEEYNEDSKEYQVLEEAVEKIKKFKSLKKENEQLNTI